MKKLSRKRREWLILHQEKIERRRSVQRLRKKRNNSRFVPSVLRVPEVMCLDKNYLEVAGFFKKFRDMVLGYSKRKKRIQVDFEQIKILSPDAALVLAAELDRWRKIHSKKLKPWKQRRWDPTVERLFNELGLFELLKIKKSKIIQKEGPLQFFKFLTGNTSDGSIADALMVNMGPVIGSTYNEEKLYIALSEAMTNVAHHAYPDNDYYEHEYLKNQWWLAGSYNHETSKMTVLFYDQGVGIPKTLPRQTFWGDLVLMLKEKHLILDHHGYLIRGALELGRTRSKQLHRGKGLRQLLDFLFNSKDGQIRIISGKGDYWANEKNSLCAHHNISLGGTFIKWDIAIEKGQ